MREDGKNGERRETKRCQKGNVLSMRKKFERGKGEGGREAQVMGKGGGGAC
jgi:hypothetical protein